MPEQPPELTNNPQVDAPTASPENTNPVATPPSPDATLITAAPSHDKKGLFSWLKFGSKPRSQGASILPNVDTTSTTSLNEVRQAHADARANVMTGMSPELESVGTQTIEPITGAPPIADTGSNLSSQKALEDPGWVKPQKSEPVAPPPNPEIIPDAPKNLTNDPGLEIPGFGGKPNTTPPPAEKPPTETTPVSYDVVDEAAKVAQQAPGAAEVEINAAAEEALAKAEPIVSSPQPEAIPPEPVLTGATPQTGTETNIGGNNNPTGSGTTTT